MKVPGFRPGSAPLDVLEKYHSGALREAFLNKAIPDFYQNALKQENIFSVSIPKISDVEMKDDCLVFSAEFEVRPEVDIEDSQYKGIKISAKPVVVETIEVDKIITNMKEGIDKVLKRSLDDNEIARWASYANLEDFRQAVESQLMLEKTKARRQDIDEQVKQKLLKSVKVEAPKTQLEQHTRELVNREVYNLRYRGVPAEDIEKYKTEVEKKIQPLAEEEVKLFYIFDAIAQREGIESDDKMIYVVLGLILSKAEYK